MATSYKILGEGNFIASSGVDYKHQQLDTFLDTVATQTFVRDEIAKIMQRIVVTSVDEMTDPNAIYLLEVTSNDNNFYEEYMIIEGKPELIGTTRTDLTDYAKTADTDAKIATLNAKITELEAAIEEVRALQSVLKVDPTDTSEINTWIKTQ